MHSTLLCRFTIIYLIIMLLMDSYLIFQGFTITKRAVLDILYAYCCTFMQVRL